MIEQIEEMKTTMVEEFKHIEEQFKQLVDFIKEYDAEETAKRNLQEDRIKSLENEVFRLDKELIRLKLRMDKLEK